jgi:hypothetical protein
MEILLMPLFEMEFTRSVTIAPCTGEDRYGKKTFGEAVEVPAILSFMEKNIKDFRGNTFLSSSWVAVPPDTVVSNKDQVVLPDGSTAYIGSIAKIYDEEAQDFLYTEIYIGRVAPGEGSL